MKYSVIVLSIFCLIISSCKEKRPGIGNLIQVIKKRELYLVEYRYHDMIFLYKNDNSKRKLTMIVKYPVSVSAKVDLNKMKVDSINKTITIPIPEITDPIIEFDKSDIIPVRDGFLISFSGPREDILQTLRSRVVESQKRIKENAMALGIQNQALDESKIFIENLLVSLGLNEEYEIIHEKLANTTSHSSTPLLNIIEIQ